MYDLFHTVDLEHKGHIRNCVFKQISEKMADDITINGSNDATDMIEVAICQPDHPNQAIFITSLDIKLEHFRTSITQNGLIVPEEWVFMTRLGSLISEDQEDRILLKTITRHHDDSGAVDVMVTPALSEHEQSERRPGNTSGKNDVLSSFATIVAAVRDIYVTSIQPNLHEFIKPLAIAAGVAAVLTFVLTFFVAMVYHIYFYYKDTTKMHIHWISSYTKNDRLHMIHVNYLFC